MRPMRWWFTYKISVKHRLHWVGDKEEILWAYRPIICKHKMKRPHNALLAIYLSVHLSVAYASYKLFQARKVQIWFTVLPMGTYVTGGGLRPNLASPLCCRCWRLAAYQRRLTASETAYSKQHFSHLLISYNTCFLHKIINRIVVLSPGPIVSVIGLHIVGLAYLYVSSCASISRLILYT